MEPELINDINDINEALKFGQKNPKYILHVPWHTSILGVFRSSLPDHGDWC